MATVCIPYWRVFAALDCNFTNIMSIHLLHAIYTHWQSRGPLTLLAVFVCLPALVVGHFSNIENDGWNGAQRSQSRAKWPCFEMYEQNLTDFRCILSLYESSKHGVFDFWSNYWLEMGNSWTIIQKKLPDKYLFLLWLNFLVFSQVAEHYTEHILLLCTLNSRIHRTLKLNTARNTIASTLSTQKILNTQNHFRFRVRPYDNRYELSTPLLFAYVKLFLKQHDTHTHNTQKKKVMIRTNKVIPNHINYIIICRYNSFRNCAEWWFKSINCSVWVWEPSVRSTDAIASVCVTILLLMFDTDIGVAMRPHIDHHQSSYNIRWRHTINRQKQNQLSHMLVICDWLRVRALSEIDTVSILCVYIQFRVRLCVCMIVRVCMHFQCATVNERQINDSLRITLQTSTDVLRYRQKTPPAAGKTFTHRCWISIVVN